MMSAIEKMRMLDRQNGGKEKELLEGSNGGEKGEWENVNFPAGGSGRGYSTLGRRLGQVRTGDWSMSGGRKKSSSLRSVAL